MTIIIKNKATLLFDDFKIKCSVGKKGFSIKKKEGDYTSPRGTFNLGNLYYRADRLQKLFLNSNVLNKKNMDGVMIRKASIITN